LQTLFSLVDVSKKHTTFIFRVKSVQNLPYNCVMYFLTVLSHFPNTCCK